jgi:hypothetical protein
MKTPRNLELLARRNANSVATNISIRAGTNASRITQLGIQWHRRNPRPPFESTPQTTLADGSTRMSNGTITRFSGRRNRRLEMQELSVRIQKNLDRREKAKDSQ